METGKNPLTSKTVWAALALMAVQTVFPSTKPWIKEHASDLIPMLGVLFLGLRGLTTTGIRGIKIQIRLPRRKPS